MSGLTREERLLNGEALTPLTRREKFLAKAGGANIETPTPVTREEMFLSAITGGGSSGGGGSDCIPLDGSFSYTVESVKGASYGFELNKNGYYESQNKAQKSSYALCRIIITTAEPNTDIIFSVINYAESSFDYGVFGNLDVPLSLSTAADTDIKQSYKTISEPTANTLIYTVASPGEHFIDVKFIKDSSGDKNNDSVQFKIENAIKIPEEYYEILRQVDHNLRPKNIASGVDIFGVTGTYTGFPNGTKWTKTKSKEKPYNFLSYFDGTWIASYDNGYIDMSEDGVNWVEHSKKIPSSIVYGCCYAKGKLVVGTSDGIYYSYDGINWSQSNKTSGYVRVIAYGGDIFVAGGNGVGLLYSADGINWTQSNIDSGSTGECVYYCNETGVWIAGDTSVYYSIDGKTWTSVSNMTVPYSICYGNGVYVASTFNGIRYSSDGINWSKSNVTVSALMVSYDKKLFVASTASNGLYYSTDGMTWMQSNITSNEDLLSRKYPLMKADGVWVTGLKNDGLYYSTDGMTWMQSNVVGNSVFESIYIGHNDGVWVVCVDKRGFYYSPTWLPS